MPKKMSLEKFVAQGRAAQGDVDAAVNQETPADLLLKQARRVEWSRNEEYRYIPLAEISLSPTQPRDRGRISGPKFEELVASMRADGVKTPIVVRPLSEDEKVEVMPLNVLDQVKLAAEEGRAAPPLFELVVGERRLLAAQEVGLTEIPAIIRDQTRQSAMLDQLIENLLRDDLDPIEEAKGYQNLLEEDFEGKPLYTQESLAQRLGKSQSHIAQRIGLLKLPDSLQRAVSEATNIPTEEARPMSPAHARVLVPFSGYPWILEAIQARILEKGLPPAKEFPEFVEGVIFGDWRDEEGKKLPMFARPLSEDSFFGSGRHLEFNLRAKTAPRDWSQLGHNYGLQGDPGPGLCTDCPHIRVLKGGSWGDEESKDKYCLLSVCWEGKQKAHRAAAREREAPDSAQTEKIQDLKEDPNRVNLGTTKASDFLLLTKGKDNRIDSCRWKNTAPIFDVQKVCRTNCPHKAPDGGKAYRQGYKVEKGQVLQLGAVCLHPEHFKQMQKQAAVKTFQEWKDGTVNRLKDLAKQAAKGLDNEDLVALVLSHLDEDLYYEEQNIREALGWQQTQVSMVEFFQAVYAVKDPGMQRKALAKRTRKELEGYLKFALLSRRALKIRE